MSRAKRSYAGWLRSPASSSRIFAPEPWQKLGFPYEKLRADTGFSKTEIQCSAYLGAGIILKRIGNGRDLQNTHQTRDGWVLIAAVSDNIWPRVCKAIGAPELEKDPCFVRPSDRQKA